MAAVAVLALGLAGAVGLTVATGATAASGHLRAAAALAGGFVTARALSVRLGATGRLTPATSGLDEMVVVAGLMLAPGPVVVAARAAAACLTGLTVSGARVRSAAAATGQALLAGSVAAALAGQGLTASQPGRAVVVAATSVLTSLAVARVATDRQEQHGPWSPLGSVGVAVVVGAFAMLATGAFLRDPATAWPAVVVGAGLTALAVMYAAAGRARRHLLLLHAAATIADDRDDTRAALVDVLASTCRVLGAAQAELWLAHGDAGVGATVTTVLPDGSAPFVMHPSSSRDQAVPEASPTDRLLCAPLQVAGRQVGLLRIGPPVDGLDAFDTDDAVLARSLATQLAVHLERGKLEHSLQHMSEVEQRLRHEASHDPLTGLANRTLLRDRLDQAIASAAPGREPVTVLVGDLDDFKAVNDSLGHLAGDRLLVEVAGRIQSCVRPGDTVARLGGDEFAVLLAPGADANVGEMTARRILAALAAPLRLSGRVLHVDATIGVCQADGDSATSLLRKADIAMYHAKELGKGRVQRFRSDLAHTTIDRIELRQQLEAAITLAQLELRYQPIMRLTDNAVVGAEALVRWRHPERGLLPPVAFVPFAEDVGLIAPLGRWVLTHAVAQQAAWMRRRPIDDPPLLTVNISPHQLSDASLVEHVVDLLHRHDVPGHLLTLEVTESALLMDADTGLRVLEELRELGVRVAIDDFGTGYSALASLRHMPADVLKLSALFADDVDRSDAGAALARTIVELGAALRLDVVAEGVERVAQLEALRRSGCRYAQGYLIGRPTTASSFSFAARPELDDPVAVLEAEPSDVLP